MKPDILNGVDVFAALAGNAVWMKSPRRWALAVAVLAACTAHPATGPPATTPATTAPTPTPPATPSDAGLSLIVEPDQGIAPIDTLLASAQVSVDLSMYELVDAATEQILATDAARGVRVRVVLDQNRELPANQPAFTFLSTHGVSVVWAPKRFEASHEKAAVVDGRTALVMTLNLVIRDYPDTRDFAVLDQRLPDVAAIDAVFDADFSGDPAVPPTAGGLVWSPGRSAGPLIALMDSARSSLLVENEEISSTAIVDALLAAARRGVRVDLVMTAQPEWAPEFTRLAAAGVHVLTYAPSAPLYIHAKAVVADGVTAFVGSENFSSASLNHNRELGIVVTDPQVVAGLTQTIAADAADANRPTP